MRWTVATAVCLIAGTVPAAAQPRDAVGTTADGLPGAVRVGTPSPGPAGLRLSADGGYGITEAQADRSGVHHRFAGQLAVGFSPTDWLGASLRLSGRADLHPDDGQGRDSTLSGDPRLLVRVGGFVSEQVSLGVEADLWMPGEAPPSIDPHAATIEGRALLGYHPGRTTSLLLSAGYRHDRSGRAVEDVEALRLGDRLALGLGELKAAVLGLALVQRAGDFELMAELGGDYLIGADAPPPSRMPYRVGLAARYHINRTVSWSVAFETAPGKRASQRVDRPLVALAPRALLWTGLRITFPFAEPPARPDPSDVYEPAAPPRRTVEDEDADVDVDVDEVAVAAPAPVAAPVAVPATVEGTVVDENGGGLGRARVVVLNDEGAFDGKTKRDGTFRIQGIPPGEATVTITRKGFEERTQSLTLAEGQVERVHLQLQPDNPDGQLRGSVRSAGGVPLKATATIYPGRHKTTTNGRGEFELNVKPGKYTVRIRAYGYRSQNREVVVRQNGVVVLNVELRKKR